MTTPIPHRDDTDQLAAKVLPFDPAVITARAGEIARDMYRR